LPSNGIEECYPRLNHARKQAWFNGCDGKVTPAMGATT
jgi:hypothetical protein